MKTLTASWEWSVDLAKHPERSTNPDAPIEDRIFKGLDGKEYHHADKIGGQASYSWYEDLEEFLKTLATNKAEAARIMDLAQRQAVSDTINPAREGSKRSLGWIKSSPKARVRALKDQGTAELQDILAKLVAGEDVGTQYEAWIKKYMRLFPKP